ncbi:MAG: AAA family ATPase [bacterium]
MYEDFFGFQRPPFELVPDPDFLFLGESHDSALANLVIGIESGKGFIAISGPVGAGKTTVLRALLRRLGRSERVCFLAQPELRTADLFRAILDGFGVRPEGEEIPDLRRALRDALAASDVPGILMVDEAHLLSEESLEQIRLLSNLEEEDRKLLQIILSGQPELKSILSRERLRPLAQRIEMFYEIRPLDRVDTQSYIERRIRIAGDPEDLVIEPRAMDQIHGCSGGIPRLINILADRALITAYVGETRRITEQIVHEAYQDLGEVTQAVMPGAPGRITREPRRRQRVARTDSSPATSHPEPPVEKRPEARAAEIVPAPLPAPTPPPSERPVSSAEIRPLPRRPASGGPARAEAVEALRAPVEVPESTGNVAPFPAPRVVEPMVESARPTAPPTPAVESRGPRRLRPLRGRLGRERRTAAAGLLAVVALATVSLGARTLFSTRELEAPPKVPASASSDVETSSLPAETEGVAAGAVSPAPVGAATSPAPAEETSATPDASRPVEPGAASPSVSGEPGERYSIQVASFRTEDRAAALAHDLQDQTGEPARISPVNGESGLWYRVLLGEYSSKEEVSRRMEQIRSTHDFGFVRRVTLEPEGGR